MLTIQANKAMEHENLREYSIVTLLKKFKDEIQQTKINQNLKFGIRVVVELSVNIKNSLI